jgi:branched-chain amino acid transport system permease protein
LNQNATDSGIPASTLAKSSPLLAADVVGGIDPSFPVKFLVTFLIVVTIGGSNGIMGALFGALLLGVLDVAGKYYAPAIGAFIIYAVMVVTLVVRPQGLFARGEGR